MILQRLFSRRPTAEAARRLYGRVVDQARTPAFYRDYGVPDSLDGRFEMIALHAFLVLHRLKREGERAAPLGQALFDAMFLDLDASLREMGAGDLGVGPRVKRMATAFYGRIAAYEHGLAAGDEALAAALRRNLYGTVDPPAGPVEAMAVYLCGGVAALAAQPAERLLQGRVDFPPPVPS